MFLDYLDEREKGSVKSIPFCVLKGSKIYLVKSKMDITELKDFEDDEEISDFQPQCQSNTGMSIIILIELATEWLQCILIITCR